MVGIYIIENLSNGKKYVGKSKNVERRIMKHRKRLTLKVHKNEHLQNSFNKYRVENFTFRLVEKCGKSQLDKREKFWISKLKTFNGDLGFNKTLGGEGTLGTIPWNKGLTKFTSKILKKAGKKVSEHHKKYKPNLGIPRPESVKLKISKAHKGVPKSESHKKKISKIMKGRKLSTSTRKKMSKAKRGVPHKKLRCPYCNLKGGAPAMRQWHFDNCRTK